MASQQWNDLVGLLGHVGRTSGNYWSKDNAQFEQTNPALVDRAMRSLNPMTGFGSALGAMQDGAGQGSVKDMSLALLQALPLFGALRTIAVPGQGLVKAGTQVMPDIQKLLMQGSLSTAGSIAVDDAQARSPGYK